MKVTPKMFICEVSEKVVEDGECCWIHGSVVEVGFGEAGELEKVVLDDGTSSIEVSVRDKLDEASRGGFQEEPARMYRELMEKLLQRGRYVSAVCQLKEGVLEALHISDGVASESKDPEDEWLNSVIRSRSYGEGEL